jgi:hypothetical protein
MAKKIPFILNDPSVKNTHGFHVDTKGIVLERFLKNPICLKDHSNKTKDVLGTWVNLHVENDILKGHPQFDTQDQEGLEVVRKVENGTIKGSSLKLGLIGGKAAFKMIEDKLTLVSSELREISIVPVGSNGNTIALCDDEGTDLSDAEIQELCLSALEPQKPFKNDTMKLLTDYLQLADDADDAAILQAIKEVEVKLTEATSKRDEYKLKLEALEAEQATKLKAEFDTERELALKDGRLDATADAALIELAADKPENGLKFLKGLPKRKPIAANLQTEETVLAAYDKKTWDELDKEGLLLSLKRDHKAYYDARFKKEFQKE